MLNNKQKLINCKNKIANWLDEHVAFVSLFFTITPFLLATTWFSNVTGKGAFIGLLTMTFAMGWSYVGSVARRESNRAKRLQNRVNLLERALRR